MNSHVAELQDLLALKNSEIAALTEALTNERVRREAAEHDAHLMSVSVTKAIADFANLPLDKQKALLETWAKSPMCPQ